MIPISRDIIIRNQNSAIHQILQNDMPLFSELLSKMFAKNRHKFGPAHTLVSELLHRRYRGSVGLSTGSTTTTMDPRKQDPPRLHALKLPHFRVSNLINSNRNNGRRMVRQVEV